MALGGEPPCGAAGLVAAAPRELASREAVGMRHHPPM